MTRNGITKAGERTLDVKYAHVRDELRDLAVMNSDNEQELHRMAERLDGLRRITKFGHHVACGTAFNRACDCNGHVSEGGTAPYEKRGERTHEPINQMAATVGLAQVRKSADKTWLKWAVIFPYDRKTEWFSTEEAAEEVKRNFNVANL